MPRKGLCRRISAADFDDISSKLQCLRADPSDARSAAQFTLTPPRRRRYSPPPELHPKEPARRSDASVVFDAR
ncbi:MAG: hypothetical protein D6725_05980 [Planctomycetota bacterium]|nr:MAG: hypothetical protein D6725_05980 [Planctomycetota bacterium]